MDIQLARTFLAIVTEGNFGAASAVLNISQSAVSLRVRKLEETLGRRLFDRSRSGVELTPAGRQFERFAISMVRIWEEARHQIAVPEGFAQTCIIGGQYNLMPKLVMRWIRRLEIALPEAAFRVEAGQPERLMRLMLEGALDIAVMYTPQMRPGLIVEELFEEELVLVTADPEFDGTMDERYLFVDWGPEFSAAHAVAFPGHVPRMTFAIGSLGINFMIREKRAGYLPARVAREHLESGAFTLFAGAPTFRFPCYVVHNSELDDDLRGPALRELRRIVRALDSQQDEILEDLGHLSGESIQMLPLT